MTDPGFIICLTLYMLPGIAAAVRQHHQKNPIFLVNLFLGWTIIGWIVAMIWAVSAKRRIDSKGFIIGETK